MSPAPPKDEISAEVEEEVAELGDPEASSPLPSGALASQAALPIEEVLPGRGTSREIWNLAWPVILAQVLASLVSLVDIAMVGRLSREAVAAVGYVTQYLWLTQSIFFAIGIACVDMMSRAIGAGQPARARRAHAASILVAFAIATLVTAAVLLFPGPLLRLLKADPEVVALAIPYMRLTLGSTLILSVAIVVESALRADKDTRTPMLIAMVATVIKTALNGLLIFGLLGLPRLELVGAGLATVAAQVVAILLFGIAARRRHGSPVRVGVADFAKSRPLVGEVVRISMPAIAERLVMNGAMMAYFIFIGTYGTAALAAYTIGIRILSFSWIPGVGFSTASSTLVGQALGARDPEGAQRAGWRAVQLALVVSIVLGAAFAAGRVPLARLFTSDAGVIAELGPFMLVLALAQPLMGMHFTLGGALRGAGDTVTPLMAATLGNWALRVPLAFFCATVLETPVIWLWCALVFDHLARALWMLVAFQRGSWKQRLGV
jgi:putative MATE family efflux protein